MPDHTNQLVFLFKILAYIYYIWIDNQLNMESGFFNEAQKVWNKLTGGEVLKDAVFELKLYKKLLDIFHVGNFYYWFFDITNFRFQYLSPDIAKVLGYSAEDVDLDYFMSKIHPDDRPVFLNHEETVIDFFRQLPVEKITKYKVSYDYRMINNLGEPVRILHQVVVLQHDDNNNILMTLGVHTDISHLKKSNTPVLSFIGMEGEPSYIDVDVKRIYKPAKELFTEREKEIISYLLKGEQSADIAKKLCISKYTVDTHRKNILTKANTRTTLELAIKVISEGLI